MNIFQKQPADQLDYDLDFSEWLADTDTMTGVTATSSVPAELPILSAQIVGQIVKIWIAGGVDGATYKVTAIVSTAQGRIKELEFKIRVRNL